MKKIIISAVLLAGLAVSASAQGKMKHKSVKGDCPAATCTDHSYDEAYSPANHQAGRTIKTGGRTMKVSGNTVSMAGKTKSCPAASCTDHSYDEAYSPEWKEAVQGEEQPVAEIEQSQRSNDWQPIVNGPYYNLKNYTVYGRINAGYNRPSAYMGDDAPSYDGPEKNAYRNMRSNNDSEPLPANNGK